MDSRIKRIYVPMTESGFYILFCLRQPQHGYGISQQVRQKSYIDWIIKIIQRPVTIFKFLKITDGNILDILLAGYIFEKPCQRQIPSMMARYFLIMNQG